jgi:hypothetical protein
MTTELKDRVRCWFECLRLAHRSTDPEVIRNLQKDHYADWGDYRNMAFTPWWKAHKHLFQEAPRSRRLKVGDEVLANEFVISIPFVFTPTSVGKMVREMYGREFESRVSVTSKQKRQFEGRYDLTGELRIVRMRYYLIYLSEVYFPFVEPPNQLLTHKLIRRAEDVFSKHQKKIQATEDRKIETAARRKKTKRVALPKEEMKIPFVSNEEDPAARSKMVRNYNQRCKNLLLNVSRGEFPGRI